MRFSVFETFFLFLGPLGFQVLGSWFLLAGDWAEGTFLPGVAPKTYVGDPLNGLSTLTYGIALLAVNAQFYLAIARTTRVGDGKLAALLLAVPCAALILVKLIVYGLFHRKWNPTFAAGPVANFILHITTMLLAAFFAWRYWAGQAPVQPQPIARRPWDLFTLFFIVVKPVSWLIFFVVAFFWPVQYLTWAVPAFVDTTYEVLLSSEPTVLYTRLWAVVFFSAVLTAMLNMWRADAVTTRRVLIVCTATTVAVAWAYGDLIRTYPPAALASAPTLLFVVLAIDIVSNLFVIYTKSAPGSPGALPVDGSYAPAAGPYGTASPPYAYA